MNERLLQFLRCPKCLDALHALVYERETANGEISAGLLVSQCGAVYPIWKRVPRMLLPYRRALPDGFLRQFRDRLAADGAELLHESRVQEPAKTYSFDVQWSMYEYGEVTWELDVATRVNNFYRYLRMEPGSLNGALVLDAGCGNGTLTAGIAASGPEIIGMDYSESVERAEKEKGRFAGEASSRVHFLQGDVQHPPFAPRTFDVVYSDGVLHHTPNTQDSFRAIAPLVNEAGRCFVWLYRSDLSPLFKVKSMAVATLQSILRPLPLPVVKYLCLAGAAILLLRLRLLRLFGNRKRRLIPLRLKAVNLFDTLTPSYNHLQTPAEVQDWFRTTDFSETIETSIPSLSDGGFGMLGLRRRHLQAVMHRAASSV